MKKRIGLVGLGKHMNSKLYPAILETKLSYSVFSYDIDGGNQAVFSKSNRVEEMNGSLFDNTGDIEALITALPPTESTEVLEVSAAKHLPLYLEKPGLRSVQNYDDAIASLGNGARHIFLGFNFRFAPAVLSIRNYLAQSKIGPAFGSLRFLSQHPNSSEWGSSTAFEAWIRNNGVHAFDLLRFVFGPPCDIHLSGVTWVGNQFMAFATFHWPDGGNIRLEFGNATTSFQISLELQAGVDTRISFGDLTQCAVTDLASNLSHDLFHQNNESHFVISGYVGALSEFLHRARIFKPIGASFYDGLEAMRIAEQILSYAQQQFHFQTDISSRRNQT